MVSIHGLMRVGRQPGWTELFTSIARMLLYLAVLLLGMPVMAVGPASEQAPPFSSESRTNAPLTLTSLNTFRGANADTLPLPEPVPDVPDDQPAWDLSPLPPTFGERLDSLHDRTCQTMQHMFDRVDSWFTMPGGEELPAVECPFFIGVESEFLNRGAGIETLYDVNFDMKLRLPNFERRLRLFVTTEPLDEFVSAEPARVDPAADYVRQEFITGFKRQLDRLFDASVGVKAGSNPELFGAIKFSQHWRVWGWDARPSLKGYWTTQQGFGISGGFLVERWSGPWLFRSASGAKVTEETQDLKWSETVTFGYAQELIHDRRFGSLAQARDFGRGGGINASIEGQGSESDAYGVNMFYRFPLRGSWLYLHVAPGVRWTEERDWAMDYGVRLGLDFVFSALCVVPEEQ